MFLPIPRLPIPKSPRQIKQEIDTDRVVREVYGLEWDTAEQIERSFNILPCKHLIEELPNIIHQRLHGY